LPQYVPIASACSKSGSIRTRRSSARVRQGKRRVDEDEPIQTEQHRPGQEQVTPRISWLGRPRVACEQHHGRPCVQRSEPHARPEGGPRAPEDAPSGGKGGDGGCKDADEPERRPRGQRFVASPVTMPTISVNARMGRNWPPSAIGRTPATSLLRDLPAGRTIRVSLPRSKDSPKQYRSWPPRPPSRLQGRPPASCSAPETCFRSTPLFARII
jgi:hypothetical protein